MTIRIEALRLVARDASVAEHARPLDAAALHLLAADLALYWFEPVPRTQHRVFARLSYG